MEQWVPPIATRRRSVIFAIPYVIGGVEALETQKLIASDGAPLDLFGLSVAIDGGSLITGATGDDNENGTDAGAGYVFE